MFTLDINLSWPHTAGTLSERRSDIMGDNSPKDKAKKNQRQAEKTKKEGDAAKAKEAAAAATKK